MKSLPLLVLTLCTLRVMPSPALLSAEAPSCGLLFPLTGGDADRFGHVTPFLSVDAGQATVFFGAATRQTWDGNAIASATVTLPE